MASALPRTDKPLWTLLVTPHNQGSLYQFNRDGNRIQCGVDPLLAWLILGEMGLVLHEKNSVVYGAFL